MTVASPSTAPAFFAGLKSRLDRRGEPLYLQIAALVRAGIDAGDLRPGDTVPPQRQLSVDWAVGEVTIRRAFQELANQGWLSARAGGGTVIRDRGEPPPDATIPRPLSIGVAFADLADGYPFMRPLLDGVRDTPRPVAVRAFDVPPGETPMPVLASTLPLAGMDGLIAMSPVNLRLLGLCQERKLPCVLLFSDIADGFTRCVVVDYARGVFQAVRHLTDRGCRQIALVTAGPQRFSTGQWIDAYRGALAFVDAAPHRERIVRVGYDEADGYRATRLLLTGDDPPDAILYASDFLARGGLLAAHELGRRVPKDLRIVGAGRVLAGDAGAAPLATIDLQIAELGRIARGMLEAPPGEPDSRGYRISVPSRFLPGATA